MKCKDCLHYGICEYRTIVDKEIECKDFIYNIKYDLKDDGVYMELFAVKDGIRYNAKVISINEASKTLTNSLMDGIEKLWT